MIELETTTLVVGSGPAGFAAAYYAAAAGTVLVVDAHQLPRSKSCGGMIHPLTLDILAEIATLPDRLLLTPPRVTFRYHAWDTDQTCLTDLSFINVDRADFDTWLLEQLPGNIEIMDKTVYKSHVSQADGSIRVTLAHEGQETVVTCQYLVGADGARSSVRRQLGLADLEKFVTLQDFCIMQGEFEPIFDCFWLDDIEEFGIGYIVPKSDLILVGVVYYPGTRQASQLQDRILTRLRQRLPIGDSVRREAWVAPKHRSIRDVSAGIGNVLLAGEAGGFISPTSGEGISWALASGRAAGKAIATAATASQPASALQAYNRGVAHLRRSIAWRLRVFPIINSRWGKKLMRITPQKLISAITHHL